MPLLLTVGGAVGVMAGTANAETVAGDVSIECNARLFEDPDRSGSHTTVSSGTLTPLVVTVGDDGKVKEVNDIYDIDIGESGTGVSSIDVTCAVVNRSTEDVTIAASIDHLAPPLSPGADAPGPSCGQGRKGHFYTLYKDGNGLKFTITEENFPRDFPECDDNLLRISMDIGVQP